MKGKVLITGASGFLGRHIANSLLNEGYDVIALKRACSNISDLKIRNQARLKWVDIDSLDFDEFFSKNKVDSIIHTSTCYGRSGEDVTEVFAANIDFPFRLLNAAIKSGVSLFINSDTLLDKNINSYSLTKKQFSEWLVYFSNKIQVINLRIEHMYGENESDSKFVPWFLSQLANRVEKINLTEGEQQRDFIYIDDVVTAFLCVLKCNSRLNSYSEFDVGTGRLTKVRDFLEMLFNEYESKFGVVSSRMIFGAIPYRHNELMSPNLDVTKLRELGWIHEVDLNSGIKRIVGVIK